MYFPVATKKGGMATTPGPLDVCKTPAAPAPLPIPYPNIARLSGTDKPCKKVLASNKPVVVQNSKVKRSNGDEAGTLKGIVSSKNMDQCQFKKYSGKVLAKGKKVVLHTAITTHNGSTPNGMGAHVAPSQTKVLGHM